MSEVAPKKFAAGFWSLYTAQAISIIGSQSVQFAIIWWITASTQSVTVLATASAIALLPQVVLGPFLGTLVDRYNRKLIMLLSDSSVALISVWLAWQFATGSASPLSIYVVLAVRAVGTAMHAPAMTASSTLMVPAKHYERIQGLNQIIQGGSPLIAAPIGAVLFSVMPMYQVILVDVFSAIIALVALLFVVIPQPQTEATEQSRSSMLSEFLAGLTYIWNKQQLVILLVAIAVLNFCVVPAFSLLPLFVTQELNGDAYSLSALQIGFGIGGLAGGAFLAAWGGFEKQINTVLVGFACVALSTIIVGVVTVPTLVVFTLALMALGAGVSIANGACMAIFQLAVLPEYQGRVFAMFGSVVGAIAPIGIIFSAPIAELFGLRAWYIAGGIGCVVVIVVLARLYPQSPRIES